MKYFAYSLLFLTLTNFNETRLQTITMATATSSVPPQSSMAPRGEQSQEQSKIINLEQSSQMNINKYINKNNDDAQTGIRNFYPVFNKPGVENENQKKIKFERANLFKRISEQSKQYLYGPDYDFENDFDEKGMDESTGCDTTFNDFDFFDVDLFNNKVRICTQYLKKLKLDDNFPVQDILNTISFGGLCSFARCEAVFKQYAARFQKEYQKYEQKVKELKEQLVQTKIEEQTLQNEQEVLKKQNMDKNEQIQQQAENKEKEVEQDENEDINTKLEENENQIAELQGRAEEEAAQIEEYQKIQKELQQRIAACDQWVNEKFLSVQDDLTYYIKNNVMKVALQKAEEFNIFLKNFENLETTSYYDVYRLYLDLQREYVENTRHIARVYDLAQKYMMLDSKMCKVYKYRINVLGIDAAEFSKYLFILSELQDTYTKLKAASTRKNLDLKNEASYDLGYNQNFIKDYEELFGNTSKILNKELGKTGILMILGKHVGVDGLGPGCDVDSYVCFNSFFGFAKDFLKFGFNELSSNFQLSPMLQDENVLYNNEGQNYNISLVNYVRSLVQIFEKEKSNEQDFDKNVESYRMLGLKPRNENEGALITPEEKEFIKEFYSSVLELYVKAIYEEQVERILDYFERMLYENHHICKIPYDQYPLSRLGSWIKLVENRFAELEDAKNAELEGAKNAELEGDKNAELEGAKEEQQAEGGEDKGLDARIQNIDYELKNLAVSKSLFSDFYVALMKFWEPSTELSGKLRYNFEEEYQNNSLNLDEDEKENQDEENNENDNPGSQEYNQTEVIDEDYNPEEQNYEEYNDNQNGENNPENQENYIPNENKGEEKGEDELNKSNGPEDQGGENDLNKSKDFKNQSNEKSQYNIDNNKTNEEKNTINPQTKEPDDTTFKNPIFNIFTTTQLNKKYGPNSNKTEQKNTSTEPNMINTNTKKNSFIVNNDINMNNTDPNMNLNINQNINPNINQNINQNMNSNINQNINQNMNQNINQNINQNMNSNINQSYRSGYNENENNNERSRNIEQSGTLNMLINQSKILNKIPRELIKEERKELIHAAMGIRAKRLEKFNARVRKHKINPNQKLKIDKISFKNKDVVQSKGNNGNQNKFLKKNVNGIKVNNNIIRKQNMGFGNGNKFFINLNKGNRRSDLFSKKEY